MTIFLVDKKKKNLDNFREKEKNIIKYKNFNGQNIYLV
jgi:hypothetical protein